MRDIGTSPPVCKKITRTELHFSKSSETELLKRNKSYRTNQSDLPKVKRAVVIKE